MTITYNVTRNDGEDSSVMVFVPGEAPLVATREHPNFQKIIDRVQRPGSTQTDVKDLFDQSLALAKSLDKLSDRINVGGGRVYLDNDEVHDALTAEILRFHSAGMQDYKPLVAFMEKIATNPLQHSRDNLFRWLEKNDFAIDPDGDFYCYKKVSAPPRYLSATSGRALVNGELHNGKIPNLPGSVIEMPRSAVEHNPASACSVGLHVANWSFAREFTGSQTVRCKVNPRDVVSVPTDSHDQKMRVCRYYVVDVVTSEDRSLLLRSAARTARTVGTADPDGKPVEGHVAAVPAPKKGVPAKRKRGNPNLDTKRKAARAAALPAYYEQMKARDFNKLPITELTWLAGEWGVVKRARVDASGPRMTAKDALIGRLVKEARQRLKTWK